MPLYEFVLASAYQDIKFNYKRKKPKANDFTYAPTSIRSIVVEADSYQQAKQEAFKLKRPGERFYDVKDI